MLCPGDGGGGAGALCARGAPHPAPAPHLVLRQCGQVSVLVPAASPVQQQLSLHSEGSVPEDDNSLFAYPGKAACIDWEQVGKPCKD